MPPKRKRSSNTPVYRNVKARKYKRKMVKGRRPARRARKFAPDPTVQRINPARIDIVRVAKSLRLIPTFGAAAKGFTGLQIGPLTTSAVGVAGNYTFDPAGVFGNFSGTVTSFVVDNGPAAIANWVSYTNLYKYYKVIKVTVQFRYDDTSTADTCSPTIYVRYHDGEYNTDVPSATVVAAERNWIAKRFDASNNTFKYSFIPLVQNITGGVAAATAGRSARRMQWTSVATPVEIFGLRMYFNWPANSAADLNSWINTDVTYHISFKEQA